jgi:general secretion pathway protein C
MQAATVPFYSNGSLTGFTLWDIEKGSIYEQFGFQDGDTVTTINEQKINDVGRTVKLLNSLRTETVANITYLRNGVETSVRIEIQ